MMFIGHFVVPALVRRCVKLPRVPLFVGSVMPDLWDKGWLWWGNGRYRRSFGHTLLGLAGSGTAVWLLGGRQRGLAWLVGYGLHLLGDGQEGVPWLYPFKTYRFYATEKRQFSWRYLLWRMRHKTTAVEWALTFFWLALHLFQLKRVASPSS